MNWDPVYMVNVILCIIILVFGGIAYRRSQSNFALYIAIAFGLFGLSHLATLLSLNKTLELPLIVVRTLAYLIVVFAVYKAAFTKKASRK